ncbi:hypothetical protein HYPSUDRAFT_86223 [Hypholoma sublateritium FD-334 SS-4]|uniref:Ricin B lectin domain-containing protein n=1 Tax=Hypholoma sublateritium (strain FD-334 SS-4) TaxID=945553 RepID=A0A0D2LAM1_HYPSF|nr:hypothetical protein HYPSUDRAFT_86223 [Hypholoma sublateritium FD-334 SS-4]
MVSRRSSTEISTNHSVTSEEGTIGEDNMPSHNDNPTFYFYGPQFLVNSKGNALNPELDLHDYEDTQNEPDIPSSIVVHSFHGGDTQQWLVHDDGKGGAALMSKHNNKYVVPTSKGGISSRDAPYFWKISKNGKGYRFGMKRPSSLCLWLVNNTAKLGDPLGIEYEPIFIFQSTSEKYTAIKKLQFMPTPEPIAQPADARIFASGGVQSNAKICNENHQALEPVFPDLALGLPSHHILDTVATGRECSGFPTGFFRIRAVGSSLYWSLHCADSGRDGNLLMLWALVDEEDSQAFYIDKRGELCLCGGHVDVLGNALVYTKTRAPTVPWPNPWSHPMPTFSYSEQRKSISVKFYADPCVSGRWPRAEKEWREKVFVVAAQCAEGCQCF